MTRKAYMKKTNSYKERAFRLGREMSKYDNSLSWFYRPNPALGGKSPQDALHNGYLELVVPLFNLAFKNKDIPTTEKPKTKTYPIKHFEDEEYMLSNAEDQYLEEEEPEWTLQEKCQDCEGWGIYSEDGTCSAETHICNTCKGTGWASIPKRISDTYYEDDHSLREEENAIEERMYREDYQIYCGRSCAEDYHPHDSYYQHYQHGREM